MNVICKYAYHRHVNQYESDFSMTNKVHDTFDAYNVS